jgi:hypothetical protein
MEVKVVYKFVSSIDVFLWESSWRILMYDQYVLIEPLG